MASANADRIALGEKLRTARLAAGMTVMGAVEDEMGWYTGKLGRVEAGTRNIARAEVERLAKMYRIPKSELSGLLSLHTAAKKRETPAHVADFAQTYVALEQSARRILHHDPILIPALAQTPEYARALLATSGRGDTEARLAHRMARQALLDRSDPPELRIILGEAALHQEVGGAAALLAQLIHLQNMVRRERVWIRVMPFAAGAHRGIGIGFRLIETEATRRIYLEGFTDATYLHEPEDVETYISGFEHLWTSALPEQDSGAIIQRRIDEGGDRAGGTLA